MLGVIGVWRNLALPNGFIASSIPEAIAAPTAMQPASPTPFTPNGLSGGGRFEMQDLHLRDFGRIRNEEIDEIGVDRIAGGIELDPLVKRAGQALGYAAHHLSLDDGGN